MEERLIINGGKKLIGEVKIDASKNAFLPILAACVLCNGEICLENYVDLTDLGVMREILQSLNITSKLDGKRLILDARDAKNERISHELTMKVRASIFVLGALLGRFRSAVIAYPGGCNIGSRPIDLHIKGFKALGVKIVERHGYIYCNAQNAKAGEVFLDFPSVGATESLMMFASLLEGETVLKNVAKEPEVVDLQDFLCAMGADVSGAGSDVIVVRGKKHLDGGNFAVMPDRIVTGTHLLAVATCGGDVMLDGAISRHNESLLAFLKQSACQIEDFGDKIRVKAGKRPFSIDKIQTLPYPHFPTDLQSPMMVLQSVSQGVCLLQENLFENRFGVATELCKMGADVVVKDRTACIVGVEKLYGADVFACDLRAGAALVVAGMKAEGYTTVHNIAYIDRGYEKLEEKFSQLGADVKRVKIE
ncbi:MAG: UDP-N-acetylglucosamine 1-carboxyvinyltransferase [Clostridia bacterium]|nr:UDP-N-acetylglucosamine 1-carboxyvinyltransferase [Clostridia bacterium]